MLTRCKFYTAKTAGFCFGVDRAVKIVYNNSDNRSRVVTLGPIIHNQSVVEDLQARGVYSIESPDELREGDTVIIRSHGIGRSVYETLEKKGVNIIDATCPFVSRIHKIVHDVSSEGYTVLIAGDSTHPEVVGISGHCLNEPYVFADDVQLLEIIKKLNMPEKKVAILSQTTYNIELWDKCKNVCMEMLENPLIYDTICSATTERQREAAELSNNVDIMIIVGGRNSSNTHKLKAVCENNCKTYLIENASELKSIDLSGVSKIGISAGASTPAYIIKEVQQTMSEILNTLDEDFNFEEAIEQSFKKIYTGKKVTGYITSVNNSEAIVDIGTKHTGYIPAAELSNDSSAKPSDIVKVGDEVELIVLKISDQDGIVTLSKKQVDAMVGFETIEKAAESGEVLTGVVTNVVKGGVLVASNGVKVFIPASQATARREDKLDDLLKKQVSFKILEVTPAKQRAVGSIRAVAKDMRNELRSKFFETAAVGAEVKGVVKSITDYGVFVDLGGVDGLIRKPDLSWDRIKHPSDVMSVGDEVDVTIKDIDAQTGKISLTYKKDDENPWKIFMENYQVGQVVEATVVSITTFGAFAQIIKGIDGLIHISQIANQRVSNVADILSVGEKVQAQITEIDPEKNRISLSIRALLPVEDSVESEEVAETEEVAGATEE